MTTGESQMVQTHVWQSQAAVNTEELTALVVVARALQQDVLERLLCRTLRTRWTPVAGEAEESLPRCDKSRCAVVGGRPGHAC
ncbi:hypothetical protein MTO96_032804 [Rhipicephalus appendiculatus]